MRHATMMALLLCPLPLLACGGRGAPPEDVTAITERAAAGAGVCRVKRDRTDHSPRHWFGRQGLVTTRSGVSYLVRLEATARDPMFPTLAGPAELVVSTLTADGTFGAPVIASDADPQTLGGVTVAPAGEGFVAVWTEGSALRFATFDAAGALQGGARTIGPPGGEPVAEPRIAAGPDGGFGVAYRLARAPQPSDVYVLAIDADGGSRGAARMVGRNTAPYADPAVAIAADAGGYALVWRAASEIEFARADLRGGALVAARAISAPAPENVTVGGAAEFAPATNAIVAVPGGYLAAWVESGGNPRSQSPGAWSLVRVARLDPAGVVQGPPAPLRRRTLDIDEVEPSLLPFGQAVAVSWARGSHIYECAGCIPDHRIDLVLIDPATLAPLSNVVTIANGGLRAGGLLRRSAAVIGSSVLTTFNLTFHTWAAAGSATFTCEPATP